MVTFKTIKQNISAEIIEKKSKFIANIFYVEKIEEAETYIRKIKKKYNDAKHNCFAYAIETKDEGIAIKYNDDGEPQGTAGAPILKLILEQGLSNILIVVTRYFGGILLGTGGLVRAYTSATQKALDFSEIIKKTRGYNAKIEAEYCQADDIKYYLEKNKIKVSKTQYLEKVEFIVEITEELSKKIEDDCSHNKIKIVKYETLEEKFVEI